MAIMTISNRDAKLIIWNFMEELVNKNKSSPAVENPRSGFDLKDFQCMNVFINYLYRIGMADSNDSTTVLDTLKKYANEKGLIEIQGGTISLTQKGLIQYKKSIPECHDWD